ncbi:hypothetical protein FGB62_20g212 [Gracilaria domingensis]|nr:hypothetical protein FGB62_20g212 [Gracilaria domingensis]
MLVELHLVNGALHIARDRDRLAGQANLRNAPLRGRCIHGTGVIRLADGNAVHGGGGGRRSLDLVRHKHAPLQQRRLAVVIKLAGHAHGGVAPAARLAQTVLQTVGASGALAVLGGAGRTGFELGAVRVLQRAAFDVDVHAVVVVAKVAAATVALRAAVPRPAQHVHAVGVDGRDLDVVLVEVALSIEAAVAFVVEAVALLAVEIGARPQEGVVVVRLTLVHVGDVDDTPAREAAGVVVALGVERDEGVARHGDGGHVRRHVGADLVVGARTRAVLELSEAAGVHARHGPRVRDGLVGVHGRQQRHKQGGEHDGAVHGGGGECAKKWARRRRSWAKQTATNRLRRRSTSGRVWNGADECRWGWKMDGGGAKPALYSGGGGGGGGRRRRWRRPPAARRGRRAHVCGGRVYARARRARSHGAARARIAHDAQFRRARRVRGGGAYVDARARQLATLRARARRPITAARGKRRARWRARRRLAERARARAPARRVTCAARRGAARRGAARGEAVSTCAGARARCVAPPDEGRRLGARGRPRARRRAGAARLAGARGR